MTKSARQDRANAIRFLSIDAVQRANSGHPGMPMGMADIAEVLWHDFLQHDPAQPNWFNRDRFVLSNGHGSMLLYALLHLTGYDLSLDELKNFRQLHSKTPGHPELGETPGVETTTGPLGQGLANAVGMAIAEKHLAAQFNRPDFSIIDHFTYCFVGDGDLMEGISHEVCSLAGTLGLGKLIVFYDDNGISIDGAVENWFSDNTPLRFQSYDWHVIPRVNGHDSDAIREAILAAQAESNRPTLICCQTTIGFGSPNMAGTAATHGAALGEKEVAAVRTALSWPHAAFDIPEALYTDWDARPHGARRFQAWEALFAHYQTLHPDLAHQLRRRIQGELPKNWSAQADGALQAANEKQQTIATRKASQQCINYYAPILPELMGGSADLTESNLTHWDGMTAFTRQTPAGRYLHYGVREFGMSAIMNGIALHQGLLPFGGTFLTFSDYARNAIRMAALMRQRVIYIYSHDSIGLGEDGPTHQPVEQLSSLRLIPQLSLWRPCDSVETAVAWRAAIEHQGPTALILSRQALPCQIRDASQLQQITRGGYVLVDEMPQQLPDAIIIATGSEVMLAVAAAAQLKSTGLRVRVVSMPSTDVFLAQSQEYRESVLPSAVVARVVVEAGVSPYWHQFAGKEGQIIGLDRFGYSAPGPDVFRETGFTIEHIVAVVEEVVRATTASIATGVAKKYASG